MAEPEKRRADVTRLATIALTLCLLAGFSPLAAATDFNETGVVDIYTALLVSQTTPLDFGAVSDNDGVVTLGIADDITDPSGIHVPSSTYTTGDFSITGQAAQSVAVTITGSGPTAGLTIGNFNTDQGAPPLAGLALPATLAIGADLTVDSASAAPGNDQNLNFTIGVTYE